MRVNIEIDNIEEIVLHELFKQHGNLFATAMHGDDYVTLFALKEVIRWNATPSQWGVFAETYGYHS